MRLRIVDHRLRARAACYVDRVVRGPRSRPTTSPRRGVPSWTALRAALRLKHGHRLGDFGEHAAAPSGTARARDRSAATPEPFGRVMTKTTPESEPVPTCDGR
jgi:hypothetical protein